MSRWQLSLLALIFIGGAGFYFMEISQAGINKIKRHEALRLRAYQDEGGKWTIGYGHLIVPGDGLNKNSLITAAVAEQLLKRDLAAAESAVNSYVKVTISSNQYDALVSFVYNVGAGAFLKSTLLRKLNAGDYAGAAAQFPRWQFTGGKRSAGLLARRNRERALFATA